MFLRLQCLPQGQVRWFAAGELGWCVEYLFNGESFFPGVGCVLEAEGWFLLLLLADL